MRCNGGREREKKSCHQSFIIICLIYGDDQTGIDDVQEKIGNTAAAFRAYETDAAAKNSYKQNNQHFE